ncbi:MAG: HIT family protein [Parcubacteria group bacterium]|nr:HIT family protein [Parcubacteria group bacterium]
MECLFCKIANKEIRDNVVYEDEKTVAFLDINPRADGHTMVISRVHSNNILDLDDKETAPLFLTLKRVTAMIDKALKPDGFTIGINHGSSAGQAVDHLHIHVIPRWKNDGGSSIHGVVGNPPRESLDAIAEKIKNSNK